MVVTNPFTPDDPVVMHMCGGPVNLGYPFTMVMDMNGPAPDEIWLVKNGKIVLKVTHIGGFCD